MFTSSLKPPSGFCMQGVPPIGAAHSRGAVLVVSLIFLLLLTILALSSSRSSLLQEKMVGATRNAQLATFGAESALREAEARLWSAKSTNVEFLCSEDDAGTCYKFNPASPSPNADVVAFRTKPGWQFEGAQTFSATDLTDDATRGTAALAKNPVYLIEDLGLERPPGVGSLEETGVGGGGDGATGFENHLYRITARSTGGNDNVVRVLQSTFAAKSN